MLLKALPFAISYLMIPLIAIGAYYGGWWIALTFFYGWVLTGMVDKFLSVDVANMDPATQNQMLFWHKIELLDR